MAAANPAMTAGWGRRRPAGGQAGDGVADLVAGPAEALLGLVAHGCVSSLVRRARARRRWVYTESAVISSTAAISATVIMST